MKASAANVYTTQDIHDFDVAFTNSLDTKADNNNMYLKTDADVFLSILQFGIYRRVLITMVEINGK